MLAANSMALPGGLSIRTPRLPQGAGVFLLAAAFYTAATAVLVIRLGVVTNQALAVVANASYVLFSRDPHLAAIGFVTSPLPSAMVLPLLPFRALWPALTQQAIAASIVSALFMAGAVYQLYQLLREGSVPRLARGLVVLLFAIHPVIVFAAASGRGEAAYLFFLMLAARHLLRWLRSGDTMSEVVAGFALAGAYLARYDALLVGIAAITLVAILAWHRSGRSRAATAVTDAVIVGGPLVTTVALWALSAWLVTGDLFPQLSSAYGYAAQLQTLQAHLGALGMTNEFSPLRTLLQVVSLEPAVPAAVLIVLTVAVWSRSREWLGAAAMLGLALVAIAAASALGGAFPWLQIPILVVPLVTIVLALGLATRRNKPSAARGGGLGWRLLSASLMLAAAIPTTIVGMLTPAVAPEESAILRPLFHQPAASDGLAAAAAASVARYLDQQHYATGTVLVDSLTSFPVILASLSPQQFVIPSDRDFTLALSSPTAFRVQYLLVPAPASMNFLGSVDAINRAYPHLFDAGSASGGLVHEFTGPGKRVAWRLYSVNALQPTSQTATGS